MSAPPRPSAGVVLRSIVYSVWLYGLIIVLGLVCLPVLAAPRPVVMAAIRMWSWLEIWGLRWIVGLKVEVRGLEHRPEGACLVAAKHQGMLDTIAPFGYLADPCFVLKQELIRLPVFGWYGKVSGMIPIDRAAGSTAVRALNAAAEDRMRDPRQIIIYPEGTRKAPGAPPDYKSGVASLYRELGVTCAPMATNSGLFWPAHGNLWRPGVAVFEFLEPIPPGLKRAEFMRVLEARIEAASNRLMAESGHPPSPDL